jgi:hypothetical protein
LILRRLRSLRLRPLRSPFAPRLLLAWRFAARRRRSRRWRGHAAGRRTTIGATRDSHARLTRTESEHAAARVGEDLYYDVILGGAELFERLRSRLFDTGC